MTNFRFNDLESESVIMENPNEPTPNKRKRYLEGLSITCTTIGITMAVACFYGIPDGFGFKSPEVFLKGTFAFLMASVFLGILAMISCVKGYEFLQTSFVPSLKQSSLSTFLNAIYLLIKNTQKSTNMDGEIIKKPLITAEISEVIEKSQKTPKSLDNSFKLKPEENEVFQGTVKESYFNSLNSPLNSRNMCCKETNSILDGVSSRRHGNNLFTETSEGNPSRRRSPISCGKSLLFREYGVSTKPRGHGFTSLSRNNKQFKAKNVLHLKKKQNTILFGQVYAADCYGSVRGPLEFSCEVERNSKFEHINKYIKENLESRSRVFKDQYPNQIQLSETSNKIPTAMDFYGTEKTCFQDYNYQDRLLNFSKKCQVPQRDQVSDVALKLNEMNFLS